MPPVRYKPPLPVRLKAPKGRIIPLIAPENPMGKSIIASAPHRVTAEQLEEARKSIRKILGKNREFFVNVHATYAVTRKPEGTKQGQGKGNIDRFVARVPAGRALFHIPAINPFSPFSSLNPNFKAFKGVIAKLPMPCHFRAQNNQFTEYSLQRLTKIKEAENLEKHEKLVRQKLWGASDL